MCVQPETILSLLCIPCYLYTDVREHISTTGYVIVIVVKIDDPLGIQTTHPLI